MEGKDKGEKRRRNGSKRKKQDIGKTWKRKKGSEKNECEGTRIGI